MTKEQEDLISEAKRRFPIGTIFSNVNINCGCEKIEIIGDDLYFNSINNSLIFNNTSTKDGGRYTCYNNLGLAKVIKLGEISYEIY